jgi:hypothetical protein
MKATLMSQQEQEMKLFEQNIYQKHQKNKKEESILWYCHKKRLSGREEKKQRRIDKALGLPSTETVVIDCKASITTLYGEIIRVGKFPHTGHGPITDTEISAIQLRFNLKTAARADPRKKASKVYAEGVRDLLKASTQGVVAPGDFAKSGISETFLVIIY